MPKKDLDGRVITTLTTYELKRRLANIRLDDGHWMTKQFRRAYEAALRERGKL